MSARNTPREKALRRLVRRVNRDRTNWEYEAFGRLTFGNRALRRGNPTRTWPKRAR